MVSRTKRGATRQPVRKQRQPIVWQSLLRNIVVSISIVFVLGAAAFLQQDDTLPILHVSVEGDFKQISKNDFIKAVTPYVKGGFMSVDVAGIQAAGEALAWVEHVQVRKIWPDSLHIIVDEQLAKARWGEHRFLNQDGELFAPKNMIEVGELVRLDGPENSYGLVMRRYQAMTNELKQHGVAIQHLVVDKRGAWSMTLSNGIKLMLGRTASEQRFKRFVSIYKSSLKQYQIHIEKMDMRYPNGLSIVWKQGQKPDFNGTV